MTSDILDLILPDIPRFYTALAEWLACFVCMYWAKRRIRGWKFIVFSGTALIIQSVFLMVTEGMEGIWWILCMAIAIGMMYLYIRICSGIAILPIISGGTRPG